MVEFRKRLEGRCGVAGATGQDDRYGRTLAAGDPDDVPGARGAPPVSDRYVRGAVFVDVPHIYGRSAEQVGLERERQRRLHGVAVRCQRSGVIDSRALADPKVCSYGCGSARLAAELAAATF